MKSIRLTLLALLGLAVLATTSCKQKDTPAAPEEHSSTTEPQNIQQVSQLLRAAGHVAEAPEAHLIAKPLGQPSSTPAPNHQMEFAGSRADCDKVTQRVSYDYATNSEDFAILDPWPSILWPGCLIQGNSIRGKNVPSAIPLISKRRPGRISLQIISGAQPTGTDGEGLWYEEIQEMRESNVIQAQNRLVKRWQESGVPASTSYTMEVVHSAEEAIIASGLDIDKSWAKVHAFFSTGFDKKKNHVLVKLYQRFYTLNYEDPDGGFRGAFKEDIQPTDLEPYTGPGNPICYISSVSYGRVYYLLYESSLEETLLLSELSTSLHWLKINGGVTQRKALESARVKMIQRGGDALLGLQAAMNPDKIVDFINEGAKPSPANVGAPISFTIKHLYDARPVRMSNSLSYTYDKVSFVPRTKDNNIAFFLKDLSIQTSADGKWIPSNLGHIKLLDAYVTYANIAGGSSKTIAFANSFEHPLYTSNLRDMALFPVHRGVSQSCYFSPKAIYDLATITLKLEILPEAYKSWAWGKSGRSGHSKRIITLSRSFHYEDGWKTMPDGEGNAGDPYKTITAQRSFDNLHFNIRADFSLFVDNVLME